MGELGFKSPKASPEAMLFPANSPGEEEEEADGSQQQEEADVALLHRCHPRRWQWHQICQNRVCDSGFRTGLTKYVTVMEPATLTRVLLFRPPW